MINLLRQNMVIIVMIALVGGLGATLMMVSQEVYEKQHQVQIMQHQQQILTWEKRALNAELAFLTRPDRLDHLTTAMAQSVKPAAVGTAMVVSPVEFSMMDKMSVIPPRKPRLYHAAIEQQTMETQHDFSSLLQTIGTTE